MRIFISSVVNGFGNFRDAAEDACKTLDLIPVRSENFGARPFSSEKACLAEIEKCDVFVLILGEKFGFEQMPGISVTQQEFRHAKKFSKPILVFMQDVSAEPLQGVFRNEVSEYHDGFCREKFSTSNELSKQLIKNLSRLGKQQNACSPKDFSERLAQCSRDLQNFNHADSAIFTFAFLPQPSRDVLLNEVSSELDNVFSRLCSAGVVQMRDGYQPVETSRCSGLDIGKTRIRYYADGLVMVNASAAATGSSSSFSNWYVPPSRFELLAKGCSSLVDSTTGWCRLGLSGMQNSIVEELPVHNKNSFSMGMRGETAVMEDKLFVPWSESSFNTWTQTALQKMKRKLMA